MTNAEVHDIPFTTLQTHITPNDSKRIKLGSGVGKKPNLDDQREEINCRRPHPQRPGQRRNNYILI
jgi:hypothetical protein